MKDWEGRRPAAPCALHLTSLGCSDIDVVPCSEPSRSASVVALALPSAGCARTPEAAAVFLTEASSQAHGPVARLRVLARPFPAHRGAWPMSSQLETYPVFLRFHGRLAVLVGGGRVAVAISTEGRAPALAGLLREALERVLPGDISDWVALGERVRAGWRERGIPMGARRPLLLRALLELYPQAATPNANDNQAEA